MPVKQLTENDYHERVNRVVEYINGHLKEKLDIKILADISNLSPFHFHRVVRAYLHEPIGTYISRIRVETAAQTLQTENISLQDIAERVGYETPQAFSKAFKHHFGITPSNFRNIKGIFNKYTSPVPASDLITEPSIKQIDPKMVIYILIIGKYGDVLPFENAWRKIWKFAKEKQLVTPDSEFLGISMDDPQITNDSNCRFYACITVPQPVEPQGEIGFKKIHSGRYAVFLHKGSYDNLSSTYDIIYRSWLPLSGHLLRNALSFEKYLNNPDKTKEDDLLTEIYIPIK